MKKNKGKARIKSVEKTQDKGNAFWRFATKFPIPYVLMFIFSLIIYSKSFHYPLDKLDEAPIILSNMPLLLDGSAADILQRDALFSKEGTEFYRPLQNLSFMIDAHLSDGKALAFHLTNFLLHLFICFLLFSILLFFDTKKTHALLLSLFFCVSPLLVHAVAWIPARGDLLLAFFGLLSFRFFLSFSKNRKIGYFVLSVLAFSFAAFSKETAIVIPFAFLVYLFFYREQGRSFIKEIALIVPYLFVYGLYFFARSKVIVLPMQDKFGLMEFFNNIFTIPELTGKFFVPVNLSPAPVYSMISSIIGLVVLTGFVFLIYRFRKEKDFKLTIFGIVWFLFLLVPGMFHSLAIGSHGYHYLEHRAYLPVIGILFSVSVFLRMISYQKLYFLYAVMLVYFLISVIHVEDYKDAKSFYTLAIEKNPEGAMSYYNRGMAYMLSNELQAALDDLSVSTKLKSDNADAWYARGFIQYRMRQPEKAIADYEKALSVNEKHFDACINLGGVKNEMKDYKTAIEIFNKAIKIRPSSGDAYFNRGISKINSGDVSGACADWQQAKKSGNNYASSFINKHCR
ncbi:MAG: hypothetical protein A2275_03275 [Bacteroidetes bacterium RIFOXYA12_FULL_35_11]|nr:MAG: hypothetical protein A2X01_08785 [Bacteroidetes bacterium GWF2_35_48]OFY72559.1 MAG: hypothetical protein A2275_03275 [Bacteroidetes bacterium RIFOXYA12_FULL_35_11]OFY93345.1 MAG: hypothetical protein A2491_07785 [Bacteroidetes bacterium RIFOXYC12_FULL_35_7]HBX52504.1 hypothetical protein [Bacteroidales bacterium]